MPPRFYLPPEQCQDSTLLLEGSEAHHALHVLRLGPGDELKVLDGAGAEYECRFRQASRASVELEVVKKTLHPQPVWRTTLLQAIPKARLIEPIVQKATELGAYCIVPLLSKRVITHLGPEEAARKRDKWQEIAVEALKQCGAPWLTRVDLPVSPEQFLAAGQTFELALIGSLQPDARHPREHFLSFQKEQGRSPKTLALWIGPEGDFTSQELESAQTAGAKPVTLGELVLRVETAAVYGLSIINYELSWLNG